MTKKITLILLSIVVFALFFPKTWLHGDASGYVHMTRFYLGLDNLSDTVIERCRTNRPLLPWVAALPYSVFPSAYTLLAITSVVCVVNLFLLMRLAKLFKLERNVRFYAAFAMLFSKYYFNYGFTLFVYMLGLMCLLLMWIWTLEKKSVWKIGLAGFLSMLAIPTSVTGILLPAIYYKKSKNKIFGFLTVLAGLMILFQWHTTVEYGCNYIIDHEWKVTDYSPAPIGASLFFGSEQTGFKNGLIPSWFAVMHIPLTLCTLLGLTTWKRNNKKLKLGFLFTLMTSMALVVYWKEDGLRMFVSYLPFASLYAGKGIKLLVERVETKTRYAEPLVLGVLAVSSILLSAKWVWLFDFF